MEKSVSGCNILEKFTGKCKNEKDAQNFPSSQPSRKVLCLQNSQTQFSQPIT